MDSLCTAAARALSAGDPLGALKRIALRDDAPALALRGIAMAQLGELPRSRVLLRRAARAFGRREAVARARCEVACAEVAMAARDAIPADGDRALRLALKVLDAHGDRVNALHGRLVLVRRSLLLGRLDEAERALIGLVLDGAPPMLVAMVHLAHAGIALRRVHTGDAMMALDLARVAAGAARIPALVREVDQVGASLHAPAARIVTSTDERVLGLSEVEALLRSDALVVDACRRLVRVGATTITLAGRPVLFSLVRALGEAWPHDATREALIVDAFGARRFDDSHRARLRVELGRLRRELRAIADVCATTRGFRLVPANDRVVTVLLPLLEGDAGALRALLADGQSWSTSALAHALGRSPRTVQRALSTLETSVGVRSFGRGRARRWVAAPITAFTTTLLLPTTLQVVS